MRKQDSMSKKTTLAEGAVNLSDQISVQLIEPDNEPARILIVWPPHSSVTTPAKLNEVVAAACRILAGASTKLAQIKANKHR
jgi:hypothetical protein